MSETRTEGAGWRRSRTGEPGDGCRGRVEVTNKVPSTSRLTC
ncbi:hypothetical protein F750_2175 [Streptomyces sp. PAMC 26508]|nr:hypothetical protein F750_2175 [Streptomyces sp. PAMC 26508]